MCKCVTAGVVHAYLPGTTWQLPTLFYYQVLLDTQLLVWLHRLLTTTWNSLCPHMYSCIYLCPLMVHSIHTFLSITPTTRTRTSNVLSKLASCSSGKECRKYFLKVECQSKPCSSLEVILELSIYAWLHTTRWPLILATLRSICACLSTTLHNLHNLPHL